MEQHTRATQVTMFTTSEKKRKVWLYTYLSDEPKLERRMAYYQGQARDRKTGVPREGKEEWYCPSTKTDRVSPSGVLDETWLFTTKARAIQWGMKRHLWTAWDGVRKAAVLAGIQPPPEWQYGLEAEGEE